LTTKYGTDAEITALLDYADWLITPVSNPDGYDYTWTTVCLTDKMIVQDLKTKKDSNYFF
jgi:murein tripeptide amidase MpaA